MQELKDGHEIRLRELEQKRDADIEKRVAEIRERYLDDNNRLREENVRAGVEKKELEDDVQRFRSNAIDYRGRLRTRTNTSFFLLVVMVVSTALFIISYLKSASYTNKLLSQLDSTSMAMSILRGTKNNSDDQALNKNIIDGLRRDSNSLAAFYIQSKNTISQLRDDLSRLNEASSLKDQRIAWLLRDSATGDMLPTVLGKIDSINKYISNFRFQYSKAASYQTKLTTDSIRVDNALANIRQIMPLAGPPYTYTLSYTNVTQIYKNLSQIDSLLVQNSIYRYGFYDLQRYEEDLKYISSALENIVSRYER
jgi:hypothetical protein